MGDPEGLALIHWIKDKGLQFSIQGAFSINWPVGVSRQELVTTRPRTEITARWYPNRKYSRPHKGVHPCVIVAVGCDEGELWAEKEAYIASIDDSSSAQGPPTQETNTAAAKKPKRKLHVVQAKTPPPKGKRKVAVEEGQGKTKLSNVERFSQMDAAFNTVTGFSTPNSSYVHAAPAGSDSRQFDTVTGFSTPNSRYVHAAPAGSDSRQFDTVTGSSTTNSSFAHPGSDSRQFDTVTGFSTPNSRYVRAAPAGSDSRQFDTVTGSSTTNSSFAHPGSDSRQFDTVTGSSTTNSSFAHPGSDSRQFDTVTGSSTTNSSFAHAGSDSRQFDTVTGSSTPNSRYVHAAPAGSDSRQFDIVTGSSNPNSRYVHAAPAGSDSRQFDTVTGSSTPNSSFAHAGTDSRQFDTVTGFSTPNSRYLDEIVPPAGSDTSPWSKNSAVSEAVSSYRQLLLGDATPDLPRRSPRKHVSSQPANQPPSRSPRKWKLDYGVASPRVRSKDAGGGNLTDLLLPGRSVNGAIVFELTIGGVRSGVVIQAASYNAILAEQCPIRATRVLARDVFTPYELRLSSVKGVRSPYAPLDSSKMEPIRNFILTRYKTATSQLVTEEVNNICAEARRKEKKTRK